MQLKSARYQDAQKEEVFDALEWLAAMSSHVPDKGEQMVRYYGYYSNVSWGNGRNKARMNGYHTSWSRRVPPRNIERIGRG
jgi:hypothetical protein